MILPAGKYYIGDPCCVLQTDNPEDWHAVLDESKYFAEPYVKNGYTAVAFNTAYGDGEYTDRRGRKYPVDSGMIGAIPVEMATAENPTGVNIIEFPLPFECAREGTIIRFGNLKIDTGD